MARNEAFVKIAPLTQGGENMDCIRGYESPAPMAVPRRLFHERRIDFVRFFRNSLIINRSTCSMTPFLHGGMAFRPAEMAFLRGGNGFWATDLGFLRGGDDFRGTELPFLRGGSDFREAKCASSVEEWLFGRRIYARAVEAAGLGG